MLFAGPYYGEFGHEVLGTGLLRAKAEGYDKVVVCSRPGREALYADIATDFIAHDIECIGQGNHATADTEPSQDKVRSYINNGCARFTMPDCGHPQTEAQILSDGIYSLLGKDTAEWRDVFVFHARNRPHQLDRNWPMEHWEYVARWILGKGIAERIVCVGTREQARLVKGCEDLRGSPLETQMDIAASAVCAIGPSSGWMHLASLCGCPHLTWIGGPEHEYVKRRYLNRWNPLKTRARVLAERTWTPACHVVAHRLADFLEVAYP